MNKLPDGSGFFTQTILSDEEIANLPINKRPLSHRISADMHESVYQMIGEASMCWSETPRGTFDVEKASDIGLRLCFKIAEEMEKRMNPPVEMNKVGAVFFFGCISPKQPGHFLYDVDGRGVYNLYVASWFPFNIHSLDGGLLSQPEQLGKWHLSVINGWTILGTWDRSDDARSVSNSSFITEGVFTLEQMKQIAATKFPSLWQRITGGKDCKTGGPS